MGERFGWGLRALSTYASPLVRDSAASNLLTMLAGSWHPQHSSPTFNFKSAENRNWLWLESVCGQAGIGERTINNSAAYLQNWLEALKNDHKLIVQAAGQAQKAADFILGVRHETAPAEQRETAV